MAPKIKKVDFDKLDFKRKELVAKRSTTYDAHARITLTKKINQLSTFLDNAEIVL